MISFDTARRLRDGGVRWAPALGDRFTLLDPHIDDIFVLSNMVAELYRFQTAEVIGFNGTTEWALDSVETEDTVWLPREDQLRDLLGGSFRSLRPADGRWEVTIEVAGTPRSFTDSDAEEAYARALEFLVVGD